MNEPAVSAGDYQPEAARDTAEIRDSRQEPGGLPSLGTRAIEFALEGRG
jgi:hypothetical protein